MANQGLLRNRVPMLAWRQDYQVARLRHLAVAA
jgi:hypothetical protein